MAAVLSLLSRVGLAISLFLLTLAVARWGPAFAEPPLDVRALPLFAPALGFALVAALSGRDRRGRPWRAVLAALLVATCALAAVIAARGRAGLAASVSGPDGPLGQTAPGPIDVLGRDVRHLPFTRQWSLGWRGELRVPESGSYRFHAEGRGRVLVSLAGRVVLEAEGDPLSAAAETPLGRGTHPLAVRLEVRGPGPRLRLSWTRPDGRREPIPPRYLGSPRPLWLWRLTDALVLVVAALAAATVFLAPWDRPRRLPLPRPVTVSEVALSLAGYTALLAIMSWPLVRDLAHTGPMDRPDGRLNAWILAWGAHAAWTAPGRIFDAPAFHPLPDSLAFSENLLLPGALSTPIVALGGPVLAYNIVLLVSLALSGLGAQLLVRRVSGDRLAAFVAGAYFAAGPHRWIRMSHIHAQVTLFLPLALLALDRFWSSRTLRRALVVGLLVALQGLSSIYLGAITAVTVAVAIAVGLLGGLRPRDLLRLAAGFLLAAALLWPLTRPYLRMRAFQGVEFTMETVTLYATSLTSYAAAGTALWGGVTQRQLDPAAVRDALFPGLAVIGLGLAGLARAPRRYRVAALATSAVAVVLSLGPETALYRALHEHVVFVRGIRALSRFVLVPVLVLSVLSGLALSGRARVLALAALLGMMAESANLPLRLGRYEGPPPSARWLAGRPGAVVRLPLGEDDTLAMLDGHAHWRPLVNGDSGFMPRPYDRAMELLSVPLREEAQRFLRAVDVRHVVTRAEAGLPGVAIFGEERIAAVPPGPAARVVPAGTPTSTLWTRDGALADLGAVRSVSRVVFEISDAPWLAHPRLEASRDGVVWERVEAEASLADATLSLYRDPKQGRGELCFGPREARFLRLDPRLPARPGALETD